LADIMINKVLVDASSIPATTFIYNMLNNMRVVTILLVLFLSGCMSMQNLRKSWEGEPIDNVTASWGAPDSIVPNHSNGGATYTWTTFTPSKYGIRQCRRTLISNSSGKIVKGSYSGGCPYFYFVSDD